jgi:hypothetical protein
LPKAGNCHAERLLEGGEDSVSAEVEAIVTSWLVRILALLVGEC